MTHVQWEVPEDEYEQMRQVAEQQGLSLQEALREAMELWLEEQKTIDPGDPLFTAVGRLRDESTPGKHTTLEDEDDIVKEWKGDPEDVQLTDPE